MTDSNRTQAAPLPMSPAEIDEWRESAQPGPGLHLHRIVLRRLIATIDALKAEKHDRKIVNLGPQQDSPQAFGAQLWGGHPGEKRIEVFVAANSIDEAIAALKTAAKEKEN